MKKLLSVFTAVLVVSSMVSPAFARSIFINPGAGANFLGEAYVSVVNDPSAVYWNPAGLAKIQKSSIFVSETYLSKSATSNKAPNNSVKPNPGAGDFPLPNILGQYPGGSEPNYTVKNFDTSASLPFISGAVPVQNGIVLGLGFYGIGGGGGKWSDTETGLSASVNALQSFSVYNVSVAKEVTKGLCAGVGVNVVNMTDYADVSKTIIAGAYSYGAEVDRKSYGYGIEATAGLMYAVTPDINTGLVARSGTKISLSGHADAPASGITGAANSQSDFDQTYNYPTTVCIGASYTPAPKITVALDIQENSNSQTKDQITFKKPGLLLNNGNQIPNYRDTTELRFGGEYRLDDKWTFGLGYTSTPNIYDSGYASLFDTNMYDLSFITGGAQYKMKNWIFALSYSYPITDTQSQGSTTYQYAVDLYRLDIGYNF